MLPQYRQRAWTRLLCCPSIGEGPVLGCCVAPGIGKGPGLGAYAAMLPQVGKGSGLGWTGLLCCPRYSQRTWLCLTHCPRCTQLFFLSDPPVNPKNIPSGEWLCRHCRGEPISEGVPLLFRPLVESAIGTNPRVFCIPYEMQRKDILPGMARGEA